MEIYLLAVRAVQAIVEVGLPCHRRDESRLVLARVDLTGLLHDLGVVPERVVDY